MPDLFFQFIARGQQAVVGASKDVKGALGDTEQAASRVDASTRRAESTFNRMGSTMTRTVTPAAAAAGAAFYKASQDYGEGLTALRAGAGATGQALEELTASAQRLAGQVRADFGEVSVVMADLATRTGAGGDALEDLTRQTIQLQELGMGGDVAALTRVFGDWGVAIENSGDAVDALYRASQTTGPSVDRLGQLMVQFGAPLREFGFEMETAAALLGKFEQEGVNTELVMGALRIAHGKFAAAGRDSVQALEEVMVSIQNAGTAAEASNIAMEVFGRRAGGDMSRAIQEGRFELDELTAALAANTDTVALAHGETLTLIDRFDMLKDRGMAVIGPVGDVGFAVSGVAMAAGPAIQGATKLRQSFTSLGASGFALRAGGLAAVAVGTGILLSRLRDARAAADAFTDSFVAALGTQDRQAQIDALRAQAELLTAEAYRGFDFTIPGTSLQLRPFDFAGDGVEAYNQLQDVNREIEMLEAQLNGIAAASEMATDRFANGTDVLWGMTHASHASMGAAIAYRSALDETASGHDSWMTSLDRLRGAEFNTRSAIDLTTEAMNRRLDTARAAVDPVFAATHAQRELSGAQERLAAVQSDGTSTQEDIQAAQEEAATAALRLEESLVTLHGAQTDGTTSADEFEEALRRQVEQGRLTDEVYADLISRLDGVESAARRATLALADVGPNPWFDLPAGAREALSGGSALPPPPEPSANLPAGFNAVAPTLVGGGQLVPAAAPAPGTLDQSTRIIIENVNLASGDTTDVRRLAETLADEIDRRRARR